MDVILDSNIYRSDILLRSKEFDILLDYLDKTNSWLFIPQIILDEIKSLYERALSERYKELQKAINNINLVLTDSAQHLEIPVINILPESKKYLKFLEDKLNIHPQSILPTKNEFLPEIIQRTIN